MKQIVDKVLSGKDSKTKDDNSKNGYYAAMTGKARTDNPFPKGTPENQKWDSDWKIGSEDFKYESNKELFKPKDSDDKELKEMLVNDAPDYYGAIVATARRGNNPRMGGAELRKNIESFMTSHGVQFNEEEFNKAYKEFSHAGVSKAAFIKGTDAKDSRVKDALMECMECGYKFKKNLSPNTFEVKCPKCGGYDVDVISEDSKIKDANYPEIYKGFYIHLQSNNKLEGYRKNRSFVKNTWQELKKKIDEFWRMKELSPEEKEYAEKNYLNRDSSDFYTKDPLTKKGQKILAAMKKVYGEEKGEQIFYASRNKGTISGVDSKGKDDAPDNLPANYLDKLEKKIRDIIKANGDKEKAKRLLHELENTGANKFPDLHKALDADYKIKECPNCKNQLTYSGEENGKIKYKCELCGKSFVSKDSKTKDQEIKIIIGDDPVNPSPAEQKVEGNGDI